MMNERVNRILREPQLLSRFDDNECQGIIAVDNEGQNGTPNRRLVEINNHHRHQQNNDFRRPRDSNTTTSNVQNAEVAAATKEWNYSQLLFVALIDILCQTSEPGDLNRQRGLFQKIAKTLVQNGVTSPVFFSHHLHGLREHIRSALIHLFANSQNALKYDESNNASDSRRCRRPSHDFPLSPAATWSVATAGSGISGSGFSGAAIGRYRLDFEELDQLGKGGFGAVFKVRNYLDSRVYAIKKINLDFRKVDTCFRALREVRSLASLTHPNIVRYYASWFEFDTTTANNNDRQNMQRNNNSAGALVETVPRRRRIRVPHQEITWESISGSCLVPPLKLRHCLSSPDISSGGTSSSSNSVLDDYGYHSSLPGGAGGGGVQPCDKEEFLMGGSLVLYMQMELCSSTLRSWLNERNNRLQRLRNEPGFDRFSVIDKSENKLILRQMLDALFYMHSQGIIHRDLKPSNVFLRANPDTSASVRVLLGDFGLSCSEIPANAASARNHRCLTMSEGDCESPSSPPPSDSYYKEEDSSNDFSSGPMPSPLSSSCRHSSGMGTFAYSAPEQLRSQFYDCKVDMFSFGIIAFEMYFPFFSYMERMHNIMRLRSGDLDETFQRSLPLQAAIIRQLVQKKANLRPTARQLIEEEKIFVVDDSAAVDDLKKKLKEVEDELMRLRNQEKAANCSSRPN